MKKLVFLIFLTALCAFIGMRSRAQSSASEMLVGRAAEPEATPSPSPQSTGVSKPEQPPKPPVLRVANADVAEPKPSSKTGSSDEVDEGDTIRVDTMLISIPVSIIDRDGKAIFDLRKEDFRVWEDGEEQRVDHVDSTEQPFTVVLMIDTSGSTRFKMDVIQNAAIVFVEQLRPSDRVMVVSFNDKIKVLSSYTNDQTTLRRAILETKRGWGTRLFDAVDQVVNEELKRVEGRRAIVLFTDGVDTASRSARYYYTVRDIEESGVLVYPIKYDTYSDLEDVRSDASGGRKNDLGTSRAEYERGDRYLHDLARVSGGRVYDGGQHNLDSAFRGVAEELRRQYNVGYYPKRIPQPGDRRAIKVRVNRPDVVVRNRDSYIFKPNVKPSAPRGNNHAKSPESQRQ